MDEQVHRRREHSLVFRIPCGDCSDYRVCDSDGGDRDISSFEMMMREIINKKRFK